MLKLQIRIRNRIIGINLMEQMLLTIQTIHLKYTFVYFDVSLCVSTDYERYTAASSYVEDNENLHVLICNQV